MIVSSRATVPMFTATVAASAATASEARTSATSGARGPASAWRSAGVMLARRTVARRRCSGSVATARATLRGAVLAQSLVGVAEVPQAAGDGDGGRVVAAPERALGL